MQFVPDGPDIPVSLIKLWRRSEVVFLAGAGVSMQKPASLPSFKGLAADTCEGIGDLLPLRALDKTPKTKKEKYLDSFGFSPEVRIGADFYNTGQFDRFFSSLESRIDHDANGTAVSRKVRDQIELRLRKNGGHTQGQRDLARLSAIPTPHGTNCRLITTNFDCLLEDAATAELGTPVTGCDARIAPRPGAYNFTGVIHLHGILNRDPSTPCDMVLSSRDFARVYLRSGVVANYVYDLARRYTLVLIGYSAEDPTMRYLMDAIGEDASLFSDMKRPYAIAGTKAASAGDRQAWISKFIEPVLYKLGTSYTKAHNVLWDTLHEWAQWQRQGQLWVQSTLAKCTIQDPSKSGNFEKALLQETLRVLSSHEQLQAVSDLSTYKPAFGWIELIADAIDASPSSPSSSKAEPGLSAFKIWAAGRLDEPSALEWVVNLLPKIGPRFGSQLVDMVSELEHEVKKGPSLSKEVKTAWKMLVQSANDAKSRPESWEFYKARSGTDTDEFGISEATALIAFVRPRLVAQWKANTWHAKIDDESQGNEKIYWDFKAACETLERLLPLVPPPFWSELRSQVLVYILEQGSRALDEALEAAEEVEWSSFEYVNFVSDAGSEAVLDDPNLEEHQRDQDSYNDDFAPLARVLSRAIFALIQADTEAGRRIVLSWISSRHTFVHRLAAAALANPSISADVVFEFLETRAGAQFWNRYRFPEVAMLRASRWNDLSRSNRLALERLMLEGPSPADMNHSEAQEEYLARIRNLEIARIIDNGGRIGTALRHLVIVDRRSNPDFPRPVPLRPDARISFAASPRLAADGSEFATVSDQELVPLLGSRLEGETFDEGDGPRDFIRKNKLHIVNVLIGIDSATSGFISVLCQALSWSHEFPEDEETASQLVLATARLLLRLPDVDIERCVREASGWLDESDKRIPNFEGAGLLWHRLFDFARQDALELGVRKAPTDESEVLPDLTSIGINCALGSLFNYFGRRCPTIKADSTAYELPVALADKLKGVTGFARNIVANRMITQGNYFFRADPVWFQDFVMDPMHGTDVEGLLLWEAFARYSPLPSKGLWKRIEVPLLATLTSTRLSSDARRRLVQHAVYAWIVSKRSEEYHVDARALRRALTNAGEDERAAASWAIANSLRRRRANEEADNTVSGNWNAIGQPFFAEVWPLEASMQSARTSDDFARIPSLVDTEDYVRAINTILPYLRPFDVWDINTTFGFSADNFELPESAPVHTISLISACVPEEWGHVWRLKELLIRLVQIDAGLAQDLRYRRLLRHCDL